MKKCRGAIRACRFLAGALLSSALLAAPVQAESMTFVMEHFPPFNADENGTSVGPFPDIVRATCAALKIQCAIETYPWRRAYRMVEEGQVDGIFVLLRTPEREKDFYFSEPLVQTSYAVFANQSSRFTYAAPKDLDGYTVGVYGPSGTSTTAEEIAKAVPGMKIVVEVDNPTVFRKLSGMRYGEKSAAVMNLDVGNYLLKREQIAGIRAVGDIKRIDYTIGLSRKKMGEKQAEKFNAALHALIRNGTVKAIVEKYGMRPAP